MKTVKSVLTGEDYPIDEFHEMEIAYLKNATSCYPDCIVIAAKKRDWHRVQTLLAEVLEIEGKLEMAKRRAESTRSRATRLAKATSALTLALDHLELCRTAVRKIEAE